MVWRCMEIAMRFFPGMVFQWPKSAALCHDQRQLTVDNLTKFDTKVDFQRQILCNTLPETNSKSTWELVVEWRSFPFGARHIFRCELLVLGSVDSSISVPHKFFFGTNLPVYDVQHWDPITWRKRFTTVYHVSWLPVGLGISVDGNQKSGEKTSWGWQFIPLFTWFHTCQVVSRISSINSITIACGGKVWRFYSGLPWHTVMFFCVCFLWS